MKKNNNKKMELIRVNDELAVSPRVYRLIKLAARTVGYVDAPDAFIADALRAELQATRDELHLRTRCARRGITQREYMEELRQRVGMW